MSRVLISDLFPGNTGDMIYNNGNNWVRLTKGLTSQVLTLNSDGLPEWGSGSSYITSISDTSNINLDVTSGVLKADFISQNISQFTNNSGYLTGTGTANELAYFPTTSTIGSLTTATYPSLTELSYIKGLTSSVQTQITNNIHFQTANINTSVPASSTRYITIGQSTVASTEVVTMICPIAFTAKNLYVYLRVTQTATGSLVITCRKNGIDTSLKVTIPAGAASGTTHSDVVNTASFVAGDLLTFSLVNNGTATSGIMSSLSMQV